MKEKIEILAGIVGSDGHLDKDQPVIRIINKDLDFLENIVVPLASKFANKKLQPKFRNSGFGKGNFAVIFSNPELWKLLQEKFNIPKGKKSEKIKPPNLQTNQEKLDFLAGWFAGDGSVTKDRNRPRLMIWSKSKEILEWFRDLLKENQIESRIWFANTRNKFVLSIGKQKSIKLFHKIIKIPHPGKERKLHLLLS